MVLTVWPRPENSQVIVQFVETADDGAISQLHLKLFAEPTMDFDSSPVTFGCQRGVFKHWDQQVFQALQFYFASATCGSFGDQRINAPAIEHLDPKTDHSIGAVVKLTNRSTGYPHEQSAHAGQANVTSFGWSCFHCHLKLLKAGVFGIRLAF